MPILLLHAAATLGMTGLIWFVQIVHYPLFRHADRETFGRFAAEHQRRTTIVVAPLMLVEAFTAALLLVPVSEAPFRLAALGAGLLAIVWLSTAVTQVPAHRRLLDGWDDGVAHGLVRSNWIRTVAWTARSGVALLLLAGPA